MGVYSDRLKNRGLRHGSGQKSPGVLDLGTGQARKKGVLGTGQVKKKGGGSLYCGIYLYWAYICEYTFK